MNAFEKIESIAQNHGSLTRAEALLAIEAIAHAANQNAAADMKPALYYRASDMLALLEQWAETTLLGVEEPRLLTETQALCDEINVGMEWTEKPVYRIEEQPDGSWSVSGADGEVCLCRPYPGQRSTPKVRALVIGGML
jgi:hypothetical protein